MVRLCPAAAHARRRGSGCRVLPSPRRPVIERAPQSLCTHSAPSAGSLGLLEGTSVACMHLPCALVCFRRYDHFLAQCLAREERVRSARAHLSVAPQPESLLPLV